tara:strand:- start:2011 stop:2190 length:180 start_codon:yes stop_codon:yes gene_type:complete
MNYKLERIDKIEDANTSKRFKTYDEAYDFLKKFYGNLCCSDADYEKDLYYNIEEVKKNL